MNEEENIMRKKAQMRLWVMNIVAMAFVGVLAAVSFILANLWASGKRTEDTYQMVYTFVIAFGFDVLILQVLSAVAQALIVRYEGLTGREGDSRLIVLLRMLVNRELAAMILQPQ